MERLNLIEADKSARNWLSLEEYKGWRHDQVGTCVHWRLCQILILIAPTTAIITSRRNVATAEFSYSICNQHDNKIEHNRPDIIVEDKKEKSDAL